MELSDRKVKILNAIIRTYLETGEPVGSVITYSIDNVEYSTTKPEFVNAGTYNVYYKVTCDNYETESGLENVG